MYCDNCHRQSPDNFVKCPYCSATLNTHKRKKPTKFVKKKERKKALAFKTLVTGVVIVALVLSVAAVVTGALTGSKPSTVIENMVKSIETDDAQLYYSLYDEQIKAYYKENWYYDDDETFDAMTEPLDKSVDFYKSKCGEVFTLKYKITDITYVSEEELDSYKESLSLSYGYTVLPKDIAFVNFIIEAKGDNGTYKSVYEKFSCVQIGNKWYKGPASVGKNDAEKITEN